jgi:hypothetical protein
MRNQKRYLANETQVLAALCCGSLTLFFGLIVKTDSKIDGGWCPIIFFEVLIEKFYRAVEVR